MTCAIPASGWRNSAAHSRSPSWGRRSARKPPGRKKWPSAWSGRPATTGSGSAIPRCASTACRPTSSTVTRPSSSSAASAKSSASSCPTACSWSTRRSQTSEAAAGPMIELVHLVKRFGALVAVDDISLSVPRGEFFAVLGPNAAGKTTTIRILAGLIKPSSGTARVAGFDVQTQPMEARRRLAYVPDFPFLYDKLTPWEFLRFTGQLFRMEDSRIERAAGELVDRFNLQPYLGRQIEGLSHGTRQRVAIASALLP